MSRIIDSHTTYMDRVAQLTTAIPTVFSPHFPQARRRLALAFSAKTKR